MKLAPDRKKFMEVIAGSGDVNSDMEKFCLTFPPFLEENHKFLVRSFLRDEFLLCHHSVQLSVFWISGTLILRMISILWIKVLETMERLKRETYMFSK